MEPLRWMKRWKKRLRALTRTEDVDGELDEELAFHLEMATQQYMNAGMTPDEAKRKAKLAFGAVPKARGETRDARWLAWFPDLSLDFKLGGRMLLKYPGISLVGGLAMAFAIGVGAITFDMVTTLQNPRLPLPNGDRIVQLWNWDAQASSTESRSLYDFAAWRGTLKSITDLGAYRDVSRNLIVAAGDAQPVQVAEVTSSAFRVAPGVPLLGRTLLESDEANGAPPVAVIGYDLWHTRFANDSNVIGRTVQVGEVFATIVGVMRDGYGFPVSHEMWMPFKLSGLALTPRSGPQVSMFGRLAEGASVEGAQTELTTLAQRVAVASPITHQHLRARVSRYAESTTPNSDAWVSFAIPGFAVLLLVLVCGNVALLMFARAATRENELIVRSALGATRGRIITQLFAEALVLGVISAAIGLGVAQFALKRWGTVFLEENLGRLPFWVDVGLSFGTVLYSIGLTAMAAIVAGVLPALKVTSGMGTRLRQAAAGAGGLKFGGVWTAVIIAQVAATTAFPALVYVEQQMLVRVQTFDAGFSAEQYLAVMAEPDVTAVADAIPNDSVAARKSEAIRFVASLERLRQRVMAEPGVLGVTFIDRLPREPHREFGLEIDSVSSGATPFPAPAGGPAASETLRTTIDEVQVAYIDHTYFDVLNVPMLSGRAFRMGDLVPEARVVVVDQGFVDQALHGGNAVGRRLRLGDRIGSDGIMKNAQSWFEIVGVVKELGMGAPMQRGRAAGVYLPAVAGEQGPTNLIVHTRTDPLHLMPKVRALSTEIDPTLRLSKFQRIDQINSGILWVLHLWVRTTLLLTAIALLLSLAGIYAVMSFTVSRRTREIGIRVALGANPRQVVASIFRRPISQVVIGVTTGAVLAGAFLVSLASCQDGVCDDGPLVSARGITLLVLYAVVILCVCLLACVVPTRRALSVQPVDALRAE